MLYKDDGYETSFAFQAMVVEGSPQPSGMPWDNFTEKVLDVYSLVWSDQSVHACVASVHEPVHIGRTHIVVKRHKQDFVAIQRNLPQKEGWKTILGRNAQWVNSLIWASHQVGISKSAGYHLLWWRCMGIIGSSFCWCH